MISATLSYLVSLFSPINDLKPVLSLNGVELDLSKRTVTVLEPLNLHCTENVTISSNKHILLESGQGPEHDRPDYIYSVWINSPRDNQGRPFIPKIKYYVPYAKRERTVRLRNRNKRCGCHR